MRALATLALAGSLSGCATSWIATQAFGTQRVLDEGVREVRVPQPGIRERISITLPLVTAYAPGATAGSTSTTPLPFALSCRTEQNATDVVYHSAFRYGRKWKLASGVMFLVESGLAAVLIFASRGESKQSEQLLGGLLAVDAAITGGIFLIPRKEIYRHDEVPVTTEVRRDCPDGLTLSISGVELPVDATGRIGELGEAALDGWMNAPSGRLVLRVAGQERALEVGPGEQCVWLGDHHRGQVANCPPSPLRSVTASIEVPVGALSGLALQDAR